MDGIQYKVNITALVEDCRVTDSKGQESTRMSVESSGFAESKALHEKVRRMVLIYQIGLMTMSIARLF